ncbi:AzlD family protein [Falsiroseomonas selenitidurans]|uniref:AzlD domain-containing protein n=1 Tax=Falsiroseomonas selenitidurans TaxID=2716335 RepID=A0ABX1E907_9PROT|nr:AzlD domain-containing protein [Falsiroseomonas selenitidurans]NKC33719.1 AzlD domain-containing protein [Falsiroseomonas selenitidurans]
MEVRLDVLLAILGMALVTYASRAGGYAVLRAVRAPDWVQVLLRHLPGCLFMAYVAPPLLAGGPGAWAGAAVVVAVQLATRNLGIAILSGIAAVWGLAWLAG